MMSRSLDDSLASGESLGLALQQKSQHPDFWAENAEHVAPRSQPEDSFQHEVTTKKRKAAPLFVDMPMLFCRMETT